MVEKVMPEVGEIISCVVEQIEDKQAIVGFGGKTDGILPIKEISNVHIENVSDALTVGQEIELKVIKVEEDTVVFSKRAVDSVKAWEQLEVKLASKEVFEVIVTEQVNGGLIADVGVRGFIPASLVSKKFVEDLGSYVGQSLEVVIEELDREKNRVILSHKAVEQLNEVENRRQAYSSIKVGQIVEGKVERLTNFGAFVNIGGVDGLVHVSQMSHKRVIKPEEIVAVGDTVKVQVLSIDTDTNRIALSMKAIQPGPWDQLNPSIKAEAVVEGTVKRLTNFGAFVEVQNGIEGLVHVSQIADKHIKNPNEVLTVGQQVKVKVLDINPTEKRLSLSIKEAGEAELQEDIAKYVQPSESGFQLSELLGDKLNKFKK
ncbi:30S ribosomal protein S1 [Gottfriedia acidiceleris]|uniref:30S ribosomal protein S1 n=1 Tax=Gottfriedia acidiceleris TaxID=371036 RepID=UPI000B442BAB|nr:30S ribosomal protein S1 [Gottfriedia acidiceleris]